MKFVSHPSFLREFYPSQLCSDGVDLDEDIFRRKRTHKYEGDGGEAIFWKEFCLDGTILGEATFPVDHGNMKFRDVSNGPSTVVESSFEVLKCRRALQFRRRMENTEIVGAELRRDEKYRSPNLDSVIPSRQRNAQSSLSRRRRAVQSPYPLLFGRSGW